MCRSAFSFRDGAYWLYGRLRTGALDAIEMGDG